MRPDRHALAADLQKVAAGDVRALERVYAATSAKLFGVCHRILADESEAEDVLQDVYIQVWRRAGAFDAARGVSPITWLAALARNRAIDRLRAARPHLRAPAEALDGVEDEAPSPASALEARQDAGRLNACLEALEPQRAAAVRRAFFDGLTYAGLAREAAVPVGTMKSWMRRALLQLRTCLDA